MLKIAHSDFSRRNLYRTYVIACKKTFLLPYRDFDEIIAFVLPCCTWSRTRISIVWNNYAHNYVIMRMLTTRCVQCCFRKTKPFFNDWSSIFLFVHVQSMYVESVREGMGLVEREQTKDDNFLYYINLFFVSRDV